MHFLPEQLSDFLGSSDRRVRVRREPSALTYLEVGEGNGGIVLNVSETGLAVAVAQPFGETQIPLLSFRLPQLERTFQASGEIVWRSDSQKSAGIRFTNLAEQDRAQIRNWIRAEIVAAELQTPQERNLAPATTKSVLIMPSPRRVARQAELEPSRDELRAAEFDRMFPSEASLNAAQPATEAESNSEIAHAAKIENAASAFLKQDVFIPEAPKSNPEVLGAETEAFIPEDAQTETEETLQLSPEFPAIEPTAGEIPMATDWRDEWESFHRQRENLEQGRMFELIQPVPMQSIFEDSVVETSSVNQPAPEAAAVPTVARPHVDFPEWPGEKSARAIFKHGDVVVKPAHSAGKPPQIRRSSPLGIAALSTVLIVTCFILGYAIQPGAFRFVSAKFADADTGVSAPKVESDLAQKNEHPATAPASITAANDAATTVPGEISTAPSDKTSPNVVENSGASGNSVNLHSTPRLPVQPATNQPAAKIAAPVTATTTPNAVGDRSKVTPAAAPIAPGNSSSTSAKAAIYDPALAPVPVSFFPVTAPSGGSAPKLMQLPEETVSETPAIIIRSHQFLFVPPQPGPESTHELERVHIGDRVAKVNPIFPQQSVGSAPGGTVHLRTTIGTDGAVSDVRPISGPTALIPAAVSALRQWRYKPTDIDGTPIAVEEDVTIEFRPATL